MRILHVVQGYTPAIGGTEHLIQKVSERLTRRYGDDVTVFTTNAAKNCAVFWVQSEPTLPAGVEQIKGVTVRRFPVFNRFGHIRHELTRFADWVNLPGHDWFRALFNGPLIFKMVPEIARFQADVVVASSFPFLHMHYALAGGRRSGKPVILCGALHPTDSWGFERPMIYKAIKQANGYIAHSRFEKEYLINRGVSPAGINVIGAGVDLDQFEHSDGHDLRAGYQWANDPVVAYVGQLTRRKGLHRLLKAMPAVWAVYPETKLLLAGASSTYSQELEAQVAHLSAAQPQRVKLKVDFQDHEKAGIFAACDVFVFPSIEESFGIVFLEAWACRKPVVGLRSGAIPTVVSDGLDGLLAEPDDESDLARAICALLGNPGQRERLGAAGYKKVKENYTWDIVADKYRAVYANVVENNENAKPTPC